jgi:hypothetical protein
MVEISIQGMRRVYPNEWRLITYVLKLIRTHPAFVNKRTTVLASELIMEVTTMDEGVENSTQQTVPYTRFVSVMEKAMQTSAVIAITLPDGSRQERVVPIMPATLVYIPLLKDAALDFTNIPEHDINYDNEKLSLGLFGSLLDFVKQDVDEQAKESLKDAE